MTERSQPIDKDAVSAAAVKIAHAMGRFPDDDVVQDAAHAVVEAPAHPTEQTDDAVVERERSLQAIGDQVAYWLKWVEREREAEGLETTADTHIMLNGYDGAPPHWPSVGQLKAWLAVLHPTKFRQ